MGKALVEELLNKDPQVAVFAVARGEKELQELAKQHPGRVIPIVANLAQSEGIQTVQTTLSATLGEEKGLSYLIHNAAMLGPIGYSHYLQRQPIDSTWAQMQESYALNVTAPHLLTIALLSQLEKAKDPRVLFVSSSAAEGIFPGGETYAATKAALDHVARHFQSSLKDSISVAFLHPGVVDTEMVKQLRDSSPEHLRSSEQFRKAKANRTLLSPSASAQFIVYLLYETTPEKFSEKKWNIYTSDLPPFSPKTAPLPFDPDRVAKNR